MDFLARSLKPKPCLKTLELTLLSIWMFRIPRSSTGLKGAGFTSPAVVCITTSITLRKWLVWTTTRGRS
ncbi:hypothetical protein GBAR_LOCUS7391 [Geodia barretti]|uniref:Uncharacterized protein n=1 Tax=Geodia barretti TaxID=519541 RepID=A0AA35RHA4_GEOBA|nr:hypothetical protein GBAR_LOCUS7391 [Geodia barretti]